MAASHLSSLEDRMVALSEKVKDWMGVLTINEKEVTAEKHPELDITGRWKRDEVECLPKFTGRPILYQSQSQSQLHFLQVERSCYCVTQKAKGQVHE